jgi:membrane protein implicated in regulation of membrane protease activity
VTRSNTCGTWPDNQPIRLPHAAALNALLAAVSVDFGVGGDWLSLSFMRDKTMFNVFLFCAVIGGTLLVIQTAMTAIGLVDSDLELGEDVALEAGGDFDAGEMDLGDLDAGADMDVAVDFDADAGDLDAETGDSDTHSASHGSSWLFSVLSFRTLVAATTFFGLSGTASVQAGISQAIALMIAIGTGFVALLLVHFMMHTLYRLSHDGTVRVADTKGKHATVYLPIPANRDGSGKVQVRMDDRIMEYEAVSSSDERLKTGTKVLVVDVLGPSLLEVEPEGSPWQRDPLYRASQIVISDNK